MAENTKHINHHDKIYNIHYNNSYKRCQLKIETVNMVDHVDINLNLYVIYF